MKLAPRVRRPPSAPRPQRRNSLSGPRCPPSLPIGGEDHGTWKLSLSGQGCPSGSVGSPFGSGSLPLPLPGAPRGRSSWRCRILTAAFPRVCKCGDGRSAGLGCGVSQNGTPLGPWISRDLHWDGSREAGLGPWGLEEPLARPTLRPAPFPFL